MKGLRTSDRTRGLALPCCRLPFFGGSASSRTMIMHDTAVHRPLVPINQPVFVECELERVNDLVHSPGRHHQMSRSEMVCHGPYRSGISRQAAPVAKRQKIPFGMGVRTSPRSRNAAHVEPVPGSTRPAVRSAL